MKSDYPRDGKELQAKARTQGFLIFSSTPYGEIVPTFSFSHQGERKKLPLQGFVVWHARNAQACTGLLKLI